MHHSLSFLIYHPEHRTSFMKSYSQIEFQNICLRTKCEHNHPNSCTVLDRRFNVREISFDHSSCVVNVAWRHQNITMQGAYDDSWVNISEWSMFEPWVEKPCFEIQVEQESECVLGILRSTQMNRSCLFTHSSRFQWFPPEMASPQWHHLIYQNSSPSVNPLKDMKDHFFAF